jgi:endonuclease III
VNLLGEGHYVRYDESTAERLLAMCRKLEHDYDGKLSQLREQSESLAEAKRRLQEFAGVGPKTAQIFLREARRVWS